MSEVPRRKAPPGACDCHMHVYDDRCAPAAKTGSGPPNALASDYLEVQAELGLSRVVVVQPTAYGFDNRCTLEAVASLGPEARGIAVVPPDVSEDELAELTAAGIRGVRYQMFPGGVLDWSSIETTAARVAPFGWHVQVQLDGRELPSRESVLQQLPGKLVIDHVGKFLEPVPPRHPAFQALLRLLDGGQCWVKLSAVYETSKTGPPHYEDVGALARALVEEHPERCLWASNWPHPGQSPPPSNAAMLDLLLEWAGDEATRTRILVSNPAELYGF